MKLHYKSKNLNHLSFTEFEIQEVNIAGKYFKAQGIQFSKISRHIKILKEHNVSFNRLTLRLEKILSLGRDSSSKKSFFYRYGLKEGYKKFSDKVKKSTHTRDDYIRKYGEEKAQEKLTAMGASLENYIKRHGAVKGSELWEAYKSKRKQTYKKKRETGHIYPKYNLNYFIKLYGDDKGVEVYNKKIETQKYKVSKQRYLDEFGDAGEEICRKIKDNNSLEAFVTRYGRHEGLDKYHLYCESKKGPVIEKFKQNYPDNWEEKYNEYLKNRLIPSRKQDYVKKYGKKLGARRYEEYLRKSANSYRRNSVSLVSTELFDSVKLIVSDLKNYGKHEKTILLTDEERSMYNRVYLKLDCEYHGKVIEFNGDAFHANPSVYSANDTPHPFLKNKTAQEIWQDDFNKQQLIESRGYQMMYVWGSEYSQNRSGVIKKCVNFLTT